MSRDRFGFRLAGLIAVVDLAALIIELITALSHSFALHRSLAETLYLHFRFFTILANWSIVLLLLATLGAARRSRPAPHPTLFGAALVYILVVCITYEAMLRRLAAPRGMFFVTDLVMHDIVPMLYLVFWVGFAPKHGLRWRDAFIWLAVPAAYLVITLVAGAHGEGYPYSFLDVTKIGYRGVLMNTLMFLVAFLLLGLGTIRVARLCETRPAIAQAPSDRASAW